MAWWEGEGLGGPIRRQLVGKRLQGRGWVGQMVGTWQEEAPGWSVGSAGGWGWGLERANGVPGRCEVGREWGGAASQSAAVGAWLEVQEGPLRGRGRS